MKYVKAEAEIIRFNEYLEFMVGTLNPVSHHCSDYTDPNSGNHCGDYTQSIHCADFQFSYRDCDDYDGNVCKGYQWSQCPFYSGCGEYEVIWPCFSF